MDIYLERAYNYSSYSQAKVFDASSLSLGKPCQATALACEIFNALINIMAVLELIKSTNGRK